jgi:hypothetical protein
MATCPACASGGYLKAYNTILQENKIEMKCPVCSALAENPAAAAAGTRLLITELCTSMGNVAAATTISAQITAIMTAINLLISAIDTVASAVDVNVELPANLPTDIESVIEDAAEAQAVSEIGRIIE